MTTPTSSGPAEALPAAAPVKGGRRTPALGTATRLALITAVMAIVLVLGATQIALVWSERSRLADSQREAAALATALASYLTRVAPSGDPDSLTREFNRWARQDLTGIDATLFVVHAGVLTPLVAVDSSLLLPPPRPLNYTALASGRTQARFEAGEDPAWHVATPLGSPRAYGVLNVAVSTQRLAVWAAAERRRAYALALTSAVLLALGVGTLTNYWVGRPLAALGGAMAVTPGGPLHAPAAAEVGPPEFRTLAQRFNAMLNALVVRERESEARAGLLALEEQSRALSRLQAVAETAASFAHEIGTPLNTVRGHLQLLRHDLTSAGNQDAAARVDLLLGQVDRMAGIVKTTIEGIAWPEPHADAVNLGALAQRTLQFFEPSLARARVAGVFTDDGRGPVLARCDPAMVEQILLNLVKNAIEALPHGGRLTVAARLQPGLAVLDVADDGPGLSAESRQYLFNPFATTKGAAGTGLGLSLSRRLARSMQGDLEYVETPRGTTWRLSLPAPSGRPKGGVV